MKYFTIEELAEYLSISKPTLYRLRASGEGPPFTKFGRTVLYSETEVANWLDENTFYSTLDSRNGLSHYRSAFIRELLRANTEPIECNEFS